MIIMIGYTSNKENFNANKLYPWRSIQLIQLSAFYSGYKKYPVYGFFPDYLRAQNMVRVIKGKIGRKWPEGKQKLVQVSGSLSYRGFELLRVKLQWMYDRNPGEIDFGLSEREVQVSEGSSYQESTADVKFDFLSWFPGRGN